eukprot:g74021.t1
MARPPRTMIDSRTHLVQSIITTIGALRPPTENESPPLHPVSISWIAQAKMLQLLDPNLTPGKAGDAGLALRGFLRLLRSTCTQFRPATVSVHRWLPDIVKSTSCDSCPGIVQSVSWGLPITLVIDEGDPSPITITELLGRWRTPYHFSSHSPCRRCGSLSSSIQRLLGDHAECLILEVIRSQGLSNYLWSKKHHHKIIFPPRLVLHHEFTHQQATESYQLQSVLCVQASEDNAGTIITHTVPATVPDPPPVGAAFQYDPRPILGFRSAQRTNKAYRRQLRKTIRAIKALAKDEQAKVRNAAAFASRAHSLLGKGLSIEEKLRPRNPIPNNNPFPNSFIWTVYKEGMRRFLPPPPLSFLGPEVHAV